MPKTRVPGGFSLADFANAAGMSLASLVTYWIITRALSGLVGAVDDLLGGMWAVVATIFVFRSTRSQSSAAGVSRLIATVVSFLLCLIYLLIWPFTPIGLVVLIGFGSLIMAALGRREEIITASITTTVVMVVAALSAEAGWRQPVLRLVDTLVGLAVGLLFRWLTFVLLSGVRQRFTGPRS
jgi:uncharacterized membrane protein YccC